MKNAENSLSGKNRGSLPTGAGSSPVSPTIKRKLWKALRLLDKQISFLDKILSNVGHLLSNRGFKERKEKRITLDLKRKETRLKLKEYRKV